jgi:pyruvate kinase
MGMYPIAAVDMLARIASAVEKTRLAHAVREEVRRMNCDLPPKLSDLIALSVETTLEFISPDAIFVPTRDGHTARSITRFRLPVWIVAVSSRQATCQRLQFSYGTLGVFEPDHPESWREYARQWLCKNGVDGKLIIFTEGPSSKYPDMNNKMEIIDLTRDVCRTKNSTGD